MEPRRKEFGAQTRLSDGVCPEGPGSGGGASNPEAWLKNRQIVILNWRDLDHPQAGGAELYCFRVAQWLARAGAQVRVVTERAPGQPGFSVQDGVTIRRLGNRITLYPLVLLWLLRWRTQIDAVLDCQNGIPFLSPTVLRPKTPIIALLHHVHQDQFALHFSPPVARIGRFLEGTVSRFVYNRRPIVAVSPSTRMEIRQRLRLPGPIYIVPNGLDAPLKPLSLDALPTGSARIITIGRLVVQKQVGALLDAFVEVKARVPNAALDIVGSGPELDALQAHAEALGIASSVTFHGRVSDARKRALLSEASIFATASQREGWGVVVVEAAAHGRPTVALDVPGLRDAIRDGVTGWLVQDPAGLADALAHALTEQADPVRARAMGERCQAWAENFSWEKTASRLRDLLFAESQRLQAGRPLRSAVDLVTRVELDGVTADDATPPLGRFTDEWRQEGGLTVGLLYGADEGGVRRALDRLRLHAMSIRVAQSHELLGEVPGMRMKKLGRSDPEAADTGGDDASRA